MGQVYTFAMLYAPNSPQLTFLDADLDRQADFKESKLVLGGDFNLSPDPSMDTLTSRLTHSYAFLKHFCRSLQSQALVDCWRALHASERDYSYYLRVHEVYTRIDVLLTDKTTLDLLVDALIEQIAISDHAPVTLLLALPHQSARAWQWKLNENLLNDLRVVEWEEETLSHYFAKNSNGEVNDGILWEATRR